MTISTRIRPPDSPPSLASKAFQFHTEKIPNSLANQEDPEWALPGCTPFLLCSPLLTHLSLQNYANISWDFEISQHSQTPCPEWSLDYKFLLIFLLQWNRSPPIRATLCSLRSSIRAQEQFRIKACFYVCVSSPENKLLWKSSTVGSTSVSASVSILEMISTEKRRTVWKWSLWAWIFNNSWECSNEVLGRNTHL